MKKGIFLALFLLACGDLFAFDISAGILYGPRYVNDRDIVNTYGKGMVFSPYLTISVVNGIFLGIGYEGGYSRTASLGLYQEKGTLKMEGYEVFIGYQLKAKYLSPYIKLGCNYYTYRQTIESPFLEIFKVDDHKTTVSLGGGLKAHLLKFLYLALEARYVPLKVKPYDIEVDLGGIRYLGGIGFTL